MAFIIGQRWISNTESQLGLGMITKVNGRQIHIHFPAADEERIYAKDNAPLSRIIFKEGEEIVDSKSQKLTIDKITEEHGLLCYRGQDGSGALLSIRECELSCFIKLCTPEQRFFSGLLDKSSAFKLRVETLNHLYRLQQSKACGLIGSRVSHLPHQIYIAYEVAKRHAPRVLLADEVGLGKTIEAGLILHFQLYTGRASRVLIIVPKSLIYQWYVEMRRRFNLKFSIFDHRLDDEGEEEDEFQVSKPKSQNNFFESEQLILCSLDYLLDNKENLQAAVSTTWDLVVVDEAHHLHWSEHKKSPAYMAIEAIALKSKGLLLLTATPEQIGIKSHFARLKLLDPFRFYDFNAFQKEEEQYVSINQLIQKLLTSNCLQTDELPILLFEQLNPYFGEKIPLSIEEVVSDLLDRYGTGRVLFRNSRVAISGFPKRRLHPYPLTKPDLYKEGGLISLYPERLFPHTQWLQEDPRVAWLSSKLNELYPEKILLICSHKKTAMALYQYLHTKGIRTALFHEDLTIIERDRAAAYFAEESMGAHILICSEIGSEGRNFQFSHHLILFDLPLNPDLTEQRIGRLDRIGQKNCIDIHVPYLLDTSFELLFRWYHEGLDLFETSCSVAYSIFEFFQDKLLRLLDSPIHEDQGKHFNTLIEATKAYTKQLHHYLNEGRDKLLEMNSCNLPKAKELIEAIENEENSLLLEHYMTRVFQEYGIEQEHHSEQTQIIRKTERQSQAFPGLNDDEMSITYSRQKALIREDMEFLSWEHPMVHEAMEMILDSELGQALIAKTSIKTIPPGTLFLETFYNINCQAPKVLQLNRFLPLKPIRLFTDINGKNLSKVIDFNQLNTLCTEIRGQVASALLNQIRSVIETLLKQCNQMAEVELKTLIGAAKLEMQDSIEQEMTRLLKLQEVNSSIRNEEIHFLKQQKTEGEHFMNQATLKLQALRVVINQ